MLPMQMKLIIAALMATAVLGGRVQKADQLKQHASDDCVMSMDDDYMDHFKKDFETAKSFSGSFMDRCRRCIDENWEEIDANITTASVCEESSELRGLYCIFSEGKCRARTDKELGKAKGAINEALEKKYMELRGVADALEPQTSVIGEVCSVQNERNCKEDQRCLFLEPIGCVLKDPRPQALGSDTSTRTHLLTNKADRICFFNSALLALFGGSNELVPKLAGDLHLSKEDAKGKCLLSTREVLREMLHAMRTEVSLDENKYVLPMMAAVQAYCTDYFDATTMDMVTSREGSSAADVLKKLLLPSLGVSWSEVGMKYSDCKNTQNLHDCVSNKTQTADSGADIVMFHFSTTRESGSLPANFQFYTDEPLTIGDEQYSLWSGTGATSRHNVAWTVRDVDGQAKFTLYDDIEVLGIREYSDINSGFQRLKEKKQKVKLVLYRKIQQ